MSNQYLKLRRSNVQGRIPTTESIDFGEIALNTFDGLAYMKKSGSNGIEIVPIGSNSGSFSGSFTGIFSGSFSGSLFGTASWARNALTASYTPGLSTNGVQYYLPVWTGASALGTSSLYESASVLKSVYGGMNTGLYFNYIDNDYRLGDIDGNITFNSLISVQPSIGYVSILAGTSMGTSLTLDDNTQIIETNTGASGFKLNSSSSKYELGQLTGGNQTKLTIDDASRTISITGSLIAPSITGSLFGTSSWARNAISTSFAATASNILGGKAPHVPYFITDTTLATSSIYQSGSTSIIINQDANTTANPEALYVWQPHPTSINVISGKGNVDDYLQLNIQNTNQGISASSDIVATANNGNEFTNYIDMGINSENYNGFLGGPNDAYLYNRGENLWIGNYSDGKNVYFFNSSSEAALITLTPSNTVDINTTLNAPNITGSLEGTSSWARNVITASHAINADNAIYAQTAGSAANGGVTQILAGSGVSLIPSTGVGNVTVIATGVGGVTILSGSNVTQSFNNASTWAFTHSLGVRTPVISVFDSNYNQVIPQSIQLIDTASALITFPTLESGFAVASVGGVTGNALSSSYSLLATYADTASFYAETDPVYIAQKPTLATTGSNVFRGTQTVTGSLFTSGSNTLVGNTILSGSIGISGSSTIRGTTIMSGSLLISGSTTQAGNNTLIGTTTLTGSIFMSGDIIPTASSSFDLGSLTNPWRAIYVQSGSISIQSDIPGGIPATISNANGNVTFAGAGFQLKSGSFVPFEVSSTARTIIRVPNLPAGDIGGFSIIGSSTGAYQPVTNAGGLLHLTSNDEQSARLTVDAFGSGSFVSYVSRKARGTAASPLPVQAGDVMLRMATAGWTGTGYGISTPGVAAATTFEIVALDNFTTSSIGSRMHFYNAPSGSVTRTLSATIDTTGITIPSSSRLFGTASWAINAQTASYINPLNQNVIITGSLRVSGSLTEIGDTVFSGSVTLSSGSRLNINDGFYVNGNKQFNYGQFSSTQTQSGSANTAYSATFNTTDFAQGVSLVSQSRITVANTGIYNIQFSSQLHTTANQAVDFSIWFAMTGSDIANSNTDFTIEKIAGGGYMVAALNFLTRIASGSYVELKYSKTTDQGQLQAKGTQSTPTRPATPSVILTVTQIA